MSDEFCYTHKRRAISLEAPVCTARRAKMSPIMTGKELPQTPVPGANKSSCIQAPRLLAGQAQGQGQEPIHFNFPSSSVNIPVVPGSPSGDKSITGNQMETMLRGMEDRLGVKTDRNTDYIKTLEQRMDANDSQLDERIRKICLLYTSDAADE